MENYSDAIDKATVKVSGMVKQLQEAVSKIDDDLIHEWVKDLVFTKTALSPRPQGVSYSRNNTQIFG